MSADTFTLANHTAESIIRRSQATRDATEYPDWTGICPVCGEKRLRIEVWDNGDGAVRCGSGEVDTGDCDVYALADALGVEDDRIREVKGETPMGEAWAVGEIRISHGMNLRAGDDDGENSEAGADSGFMARFLTRNALADLPQPEPLIDETLDRRTTAILGGAYGIGKSFIALDWALCIATGTPWQGREARRGRVIYVIGEGATGVHNRVTAWEMHHGVSVDDDAFLVYPEAVQIAAPAEGRRNEALENLVRAVRVLQPDLVIFDTLARMSVGMNENSAEDMGRFVEGLESVKRAHDGTTVLAVHHAGKSDKGDLRGSSALGGAMDTVYIASRDSLDTVKLTRAKRKDGPQHDELHLTFTEVEGADSIVLTATDKPARNAGDTLTESIIDYLAGVGEASGAQIEAHVEGKAARIRERLGALLSVSPDGTPPLIEARPVLTRDGKPRSDGRVRYALTGEALRRLSDAERQRAAFAAGLERDDAA